MSLRRAAIGVFTAGSLTIGLGVGFGPLGALGQQSGPVPQPAEQGVLQQPNPFPPALNKQVGPFPAPVFQKSGGSGQYFQQFGPLARNMQAKPLRAQPSQGFAVPANAPARSQATVDDSEDAAQAMWRKKPGIDQDEDDLVSMPRNPSKRVTDDEEPRPAAPRGRQNPFGDDEPVQPVRQYQPRSLPEEVSRSASQSDQHKTDSYGSELFTKSASDPYIQYASFAPISMDAPQHLLNTKKISLQYQVKNAGPSGVALVEVWRTCDGRKWEKYAQQANARPPFLVEVEKEGLYGFIIIARSGVGLSRKPPIDGEPPQLWVEVDLSPPQIKLHEPIVGTGRDNGKLTITWSAKDRNLGADPITISIADDSNGEWRPIAQHVRNSGKFVWQMPPGTPYRFRVRVHAVDRAGNMGSDQTAAPIIVDLATPESVILGVDPVSR
jgi:hypothetical protein